mmetsp:Transcript_51249/g.111408  ORF Transcript_51249/g.111408 Transcript_51249/m.111408 type:complete len:297 (+) Transcript_51249:1419-2309(+)
MAAETAAAVAGMAQAAEARARLKVAVATTEAASAPANASAPSVSQVSVQQFVEAAKAAATVEELKAVLATESCAWSEGERAEALRRCVQYVGGLAKPDESTLLAWPVVSVNEWGMHQERVLVITSLSLYRVAYKPSRASVSHYARTPLAAIRKCERGAAAFKVVSTELDGRQNPIAYLFTEYLSKAPAIRRYERLYLPSAPSEGVGAVDRSLTVLSHALLNASRLLGAATHGGGGGEGGLGDGGGGLPMELVEDKRAESTMLDEVAGSLLRATSAVSSRVADTARGTARTLSSTRG